MDTEILGWERLPSGNWRPIEECQKGYIYTAAVIACNKCGTAIRGMGGPKSYALCIDCFNQLESTK